MSNERKELIDMLNQLCWEARRRGHPYFGLDGGVDYDGRSVGISSPEEPLHSEAVACADKILWRRWQRS